MTFFHGDIESIDLANKGVGLSHGHEEHCHSLQYDHLVLALGSTTNFFNLPGLADRALTMKPLDDAIVLRNRLIANLEEADFECCPLGRAKEVCEMLNITETNLYVRLHLARERVRAAVETYLEGGEQAM